MRKFKIFLAIASALFFFLNGASLFGLDVPSLKGPVNDHAGMLSSATRSQLNALLEDLEKSDSTQITVLTISSLEDDSLEDFSMRVADKWRIGQKGIDNGAILIIAKTDRKIRIETGYGLEGRLTDLIAGRIIRNIITPQFRSGNFDQGVLNGIQAMVNVVRGEHIAENESKQTSGRKSGSPLKFLPIIVIIIIFNIFGRMGSGHLNRGRRSSRGFLIGGGFRGGGGGFSGGGFSGGGGGFGGGGASGGW